MDENINNSKYNESKVGIGVVCALFLGIIGLIIGLYPEGTVSRQTFMKGWLWKFFTTLIVGVVVGIIVYIFMFSALMIY